MKKVSTASARTVDRYVRSEDFAQRIEGVQLAPEIWAVFAQLHQARNAAELAARLALDMDAVHAALRSLVRRKLVRKHVLAWSDYAASAGSATPPIADTPAQLGQLAPLPSAKASAFAPPDVTGPVRAATRSVPPFYVSASQPRSSASVAASATHTPTSASPILSLRIASSATPARPKPLVSFRLEAPRRSADATPSAPVAKDNTSAGLRLRPVLDAIGSKAGGGIAGQLLIYRVFLQIPTELMHAAGVHSLNLVDDTFTLHHPALISALTEAARRHAGVDLEAVAVA